MKKNFYFIILFLMCANAQAQNVGIGTTTPTSKLTVVNSGVGIEHNDGTISLKSVVGGGIAVWGTTSNHPLHLMSNNNTGQLVIMPTGVVGIGNASPTLAGLVADKKVGAVNALFGSNTTGVALESNWPGVGFNSYYSNGRKYIGDGFGGVIGFNPTNGYFTLASTAASGAANATATTTDILTATNTGNIGIGISAPSAKLHVVGNLNLTDGTQGDGKVLTSDANGNASWQAGASGASDNTERFMFVSGGNLNTFYNFSTSTAIANPAQNNITITIGKSGLYHFDLNVFCDAPASELTLDVAGYMTLPGKSAKYVFHAGVPFTAGTFATAANPKTASFDKSFNIYFATGTVFEFDVNALNTSTMAITGYMIAP